MTLLKLSQLVTGPIQSIFELTHLECAATSNHILQKFCERIYHSFMSEAGSKMSSYLEIDILLFFFITLKKIKNNKNRNDSKLRVVTIYHWSKCSIVSNIVDKILPAVFNVNATRITRYHNAIIKISTVVGSQDQIYLCMSTHMKIFDTCLLYGGFVCLNVCFSTDDLLLATQGLCSDDECKQIEVRFG